MLRCLVYVDWMLRWFKYVDWMLRWLEYVDWMLRWWDYVNWMLGWLEYVDWMLRRLEWWLNVEMSADIHRTQFHKMKRNEWCSRPHLCTYRLKWAWRTSWGRWDEWDDTALQTQDSKWNLGDLRPCSLPLGHGGSPQYLIFTSEQGRNILFLQDLNARVGFEPAISDFPRMQLQPLHHGPAWHTFIKCTLLLAVWVMYLIIMHQIYMPPSGV